MSAGAQRAPASIRYYITHHRTPRIDSEDVIAPECYKIEYFPYIT